MTRSHYPSLAAYNADIKAAIEAYRADQAVARGLCATCETRQRDGDHRECWACRRARYAKRRAA